MVDDSQKKNAEESAAEAFEDEVNKQGGLTDALKKVFAIGVGAAFLTEETIRHQLTDLKLPKDLLNLLLQGAAKSKEELANRVGKELINIFSKIDFVKEASRFVEDHKFRISAEVEVMKKGKDNEVDPESEIKVTL